MHNDYSQDIWRLARPNNAKYPGAFPNGFIKAVRSRWWGEKRCWLFSGSFKDEGQTTVDIKPETNPSVVANCEFLPFKNDSFDFVLADPPYSAEESKKLYGVEYCSIVNVLNEMARILKPKGHMLFLHRIVPSAQPKFNENFKKCKIETVVGIYTLGGMSNMRALTVWKKVCE